MTVDTFDAAKWTRNAETLGFEVRALVDAKGVTRLDIVVPRGLRNIKAEAQLWSSLRPTRLLSHYNERALCAYLKRTGRAIHSGSGDKAISG